jgi:hypothetical protein
MRGLWRDLKSPFKFCPKMINFSPQWCMSTLECHVTQEDQNDEKQKHLNWKQKNLN